MIALCLDLDSLDRTALMLTRFTVLAVTGWALYELRRLYKQQPAAPTRRAVPRPVIFFTAGWLTLALSIVLDLVVGPCQEELTPLRRTLYGSGLVWSIAGLTWILKLGIDWNAKVLKDHEEAARLADAIKLAMQEEERANFKGVSET